MVLVSGLLAQSASVGRCGVVLAHLSEAPGGTLRSSRLCRLLQWEKSRLSQHLGRMQDRGLVVRGRPVDDQRAAVVTVTDVGRRMIEDAAPRHAADARAVLIDTLDPHELAALTTIADEVRRRLVVLQEQDDQS